METVKIETVKDLINLIKDLPKDTPVGEYHTCHWNTTFDKGVDMAITPNGLAVSIDYSCDY
jgi:hypothetical protein